LILNNLYQTVKYFDFKSILPDYNDEHLQDYKDTFSGYPSLVIGLESGHKKSLFHNLDDPAQLQTLKELHPDLIYDL